jgi:phosphoribosylanthranilate isomerase
MWIKICGLTSPEGVAAALEAKADALGFVFAESVRRVTPQQAALLARPARGQALCVAVVRHPTQAQLDEVLRVFAPDLLQSDLADFGALRLPPQLARLPVVRDGDAVPEPLPPRLLYEGARSGSGERSDWRAAHALARRCELVLAGGLDAASVRDAIAAVRPFGVDVSSGVEQRPGIKSPQAIAAFVRAARLAAMEFTEGVL